MTSEHPVHPALLSAYLDDALSPAERGLVEEHLAVCGACRERLAEYAWLGSSLQGAHEEAVPASLDLRVATLLARSRRVSSLALPRLSLPRPAMAAVALAGLMFAAVLFGLPFGIDTGGPPVVVAYPCDDPARCAVEVRFSGPIDRDGVESSLRMDPPVAVTVAWRGDTLMVKPAEPLKPEESYTLSINPKGPASSATPVAIHFVARGPATPVAIATEGTRPPAPTATPTATATPTPTATPQPTPTATPPATGTAVPCAVQPVRGFGTLYRSRPGVAAALGCALEPEYAVQIAIQPFEGGVLLRRADRKEIIALLKGGRWRGYPDTSDESEPSEAKPVEPIRGFGKVWREHPDLQASLGAPLAPEQAMGGAAQRFQKGLLLWTADRFIYVLYADDSWERYVDSYQEPTATQTTTPTATPTLSPGDATWTPTPTASPTATMGTATPTPTPTRTALPTPRAGTPTPAPTPTAMPALPECRIYPIRGFGLVYRESPEVAARLGCARAEEAPVPLARQSFERGLMLWRADTREILVFRRDGTWTVHGDTWQEGDLLADAGTPPDGLFAPVRRFGKLWRQLPEVRQALGWATAAEEPLPGAFQQFDGGRMIWTGDQVVYILYPDGRWQGFVDRYVEPTATPG